MESQGTIVSIRVAVRQRERFDARCGKLDALIIIPEFLSLLLRFLDVIDYLSLLYDLWCVNDSGQCCM